MNWLDIPKKNPPEKEQEHKKMHSSRMRTVRCSGLRGRGVYPSMHWADGFLPRECVYPSMHWVGVGCPSMHWVGVSQHALPGGVSQHALGRGGVCPGGIVSTQGVCLSRGVCPGGGGCLPRGLSAIPPHPLWTE